MKYRRIVESRFCPGEVGPRGAAGCRPGVHAVRAGLYRQRRVADVGLADTRAQAFLWGNLLSAKLALRPARIPRGFGATCAGVEGRPPAGRGFERRTWPSSFARSGRVRRPRRTPDRELFVSAFWPLRRSFDPKWGGFGGRRNFRVRCCSIICCAITRSMAIPRRSRW